VFGSGSTVSTGVTSVGVGVGCVLVRVGPTEGAMICLESCVTVGLCMKGAELAGCATDTKPGISRRIGREFADNEESKRGWKSQQVRAMR
jgi:hypothetical protein